MYKILPYYSPFIELFFKNIPTFLSIKLFSKLNTNKSEITMYTCISYAIPAIIYGIIRNINVLDLLFLNNYMFDIFIN